MRRDMDLVRTILLKVDAADTPLSMSALVTHEYDESLVAYHLGMMIEEAGLLSGIDASTLSGTYWIEIALTWHGHEFLDSVRDDNIWRQAKAGLSKAGGFSLELIGDLAKGLIKTQIARHTGVVLDV